MRTIVLAILALLVHPFDVIASSGPVVHITREKQPDFIRVKSTRLQDGSTRFEITLTPNGGFRPGEAYILIREGERNRFTARLALAQTAGKDEWRIQAWADDDCVRDGRISISYHLTGGWTVSRNWSIALAEFAPK